jgi:hypothetical protein
MIFSYNADFGEMQMQRVFFCVSMQTKRLNVNKSSRTYFEQLQYAFRYQQCHKLAKIYNQKNLVMHDTCLQNSCKFWNSDQRDKLSDVTFVYKVSKQLTSGCHTQPNSLQTLALMHFAPQY